MNDLINMDSNYSIEDIDEKLKAFFPRENSLSTPQACDPVTLRNEHKHRNFWALLESLPISLLILPPIKTQAPLTKALFSDSPRNMFYDTLQLNEWEGINPWSIRGTTLNWSQKDSRGWCNDLTDKFNYISVLEHDLKLESDSIVTELEIIFGRAKEEKFEDGITSKFSTELNNYVLKNGKIGIEQLKNLINENKINFALVAEALKELGDIEDPITYEFRFKILLDGLSSSSHLVRDASALGLGKLEDPKAIPYLKDAAINEKNKNFRNNLELIIEDLQFP